MLMDKTSHGSFNSSNQKENKSYISGNNYFKESVGVSEYVAGILNL